MNLPSFKTAAEASRFSNDLSAVANYLALAADAMKACKPTRDQFPGNEDWKAAMASWRTLVGKIDAVANEVEGEAMEAGMQHAV